MYRSMIQPTLSYCDFVNLDKSERKRKKLLSFHIQACSLINRNSNLHIPFDMTMFHVPVSLYERSLMVMYVQTILTILITIKVLDLKRKQMR